MRVLMLSDFYPPTVGGLERHVQGLAHELARRGHDVAVAMLQQGREDAHETGTGTGAASCEEHGPGSVVRLYRIAGWSRALAPFYEDRARSFHPTVPDPGSMATLRRVVAAERPHIVHAHGWMLYSFLPLKRWSGAHLVVTLHDYGLVCAKKTLLREDRPCAGPSYPTCLGCAAAHYGPVKGAALTSGLRLSRALHGRVDRYLAVGPTVKAASMAATAGRPVDVIPSFVPDGILTADGPVNAEPGEGSLHGHGEHGEIATEVNGRVAIRKDARPEGLPARDGYILFVGALGTHKGLRVLLEAYEGLPEHARPPLLLIGTRQVDTPERFPEGVSVIYDAPHATVLAAYDGAAVGVVPSLWAEPFGQVAVEAMARGLPVVASARGALADIVDHGETGLLVPPGDAAALRQALRALLADPALRARMGQAGQRRARRFALSSVAARVEAVYADLLAAVSP